MGKWTALVTGHAPPPAPAPAIAEAPPLLSVLAVPEPANAAEFCRDERPEPPPEFGAAPSCEPAEEEQPDPIEALPWRLQPVARAAVRLLPGDPERAGMLVEWLGIRTADGDERRLCVECHHFGERGKVCRHPQLVAIQAPRDLGSLALTPQNCAGFAERGGGDAYQSRGRELARKAQRHQGPALKNNHPKSDRDGVEGREGGRGFVRP